MEGAGEAKLRADALAIFSEALRAADAGEAVRRHLRLEGETLCAGSHDVPLSSFNQIRALAAGKAAPAMVRAIKELLGARLTAVFAVTKHGHSDGMAGVIEAGHPVPDEAGLRAALVCERFAAETGEDGLLLVAVSGGASALLPAPAGELTLADKQRMTALLLNAGADIRELNTVRKHLSFLKGGRLARAAYPGTVLGLLLSDVVGDAVDVIGSGLTTPDPTTYADALRTVDRFGLRSQAPVRVMTHLEAGAHGEIPESPKPDDASFDRVRNLVIGSNRQSLEAAAECARRLGYETHIVSDCVEGEAREAAQRLIGELGAAESSRVCLLAGGETTVTVRGKGRGGRNQELALAGALAIDGLPRTVMLSAGTDGTDGPTDAAGAIATGDTVARAKTLGLALGTFLEHNDSNTFFAALGDLVKTGPTGTNVMDVHVLLRDRIV